MSTWTLPPVSLLDVDPGTTATAVASPVAVHEALTGAGIAVEEVTAHRAPQLHRYAVAVAPGTDPKKIERAMGPVELAVKSPVRYAGLHEGHVIIEQNRQRADVVNLRSLIESSPALVRLGLPMGIGADTLPLTARLADMPHLLVAGTTGSGKSAFLTAMLTALLLRNTPDDLRLTLIDPKRVELAAFAGLPHLADEIITETAHVGVVLRRLAEVMDQRYELFKAAGVRKFEEYNDSVVDTGIHLSRQVLVVDELADLMMQDKSGIIEKAVVRLLSVGRAAGIHVILATQRPAANVLTGLIRANVPARVVFAVQSHHDSKIALGYTGAEKLRGQGDGLFLAPDVGEPLRFQAPLVSSADVARVVAYWRKQDVDARARAAVTGAVVETPEGGPVTRNDVEALRRSVLGPQPVDEGVDIRAEVNAWHAETAKAVDSATASLTAEEILGDAGFTPLVVEALATVLTNKITAGLADYIASVVPSTLVNPTEGDPS
jgi:S-DNA-T family DNA segregation ATPase FtsK/SpoIIIE